MNKRQTTDAAVSTNARPAIGDICPVVMVPGRSGVAVRRCSNRDTRSIPTKARARTSIPIEKIKRDELSRYARRHPVDEPRTDPNIAPAISIKQSAVLGAMGTKDDQFPAMERSPVPQPTKAKNAIAKVRPAAVCGSQRTNGLLVREACSKSGGTL